MRSMYEERSSRFVTWIEDLVGDEADSVLIVVMVPVRCSSSRKQC